MTKIEKRIIAIIYIVAIAIAVSISNTILSKMDNDLMSVYNKNVMLLEGELEKVNSIMEIKGEYANSIINHESIAETFNHSSYGNLLNQFVYDEEKNIFHLGDIQNNENFTLPMNNITGEGNVDFLKDEEDLRTKEIYLAAFLSNSLNEINEKISSSEWAYYISFNRLMVITKVDKDFITIDEFHYVPEITEYLLEGTKENHPHRDEVYWINPYMDLGGSGPMITASIPVDYKDEYIGALSVDFKNEVINNLLDGKYSAYLLTEDGVVVGSNVNRDILNTSIKTFDEMNVGITFESLKDLNLDETHFINGSKIMTHKLEKTPYILYQIYDRDEMISDYIVYMLPIFIFICLFVVINIFYNKVQQSEKKLKETLSILKDKQNELDYIANYDTLTKVLNRRGLYNELNKIGKLGELKKSSLLLLDIDHFKKVNDTYGHDVGDLVLEELCVVINKCVRKTDIVARYGGEEFIVIIENSSIEESVIIGEFIRNAVANHTFNKVGKVTISMGIAKFESNTFDDTYFKYADKALYKAKESGRNRVCYYEDGEIKNRLN